MQNEKGDIEFQSSIAVNINNLNKNQISIHVDSGRSVNSTKNVTKDNKNAQITRWWNF